MDTTKFKLVFDRYLHSAGYDDHEGGYVEYDGGYVESEGDGRSIAGLRFNRPGLHGGGESRGRKLNDGGDPGYYGVMEARYCSDIDIFPPRPRHMVAVHTSPVMGDVFMMRIVPDAMYHHLPGPFDRPTDFILEGGYNCKTGELTIGYSTNTQNWFFDLIGGFDGDGRTNTAYTAYNAKWDPSEDMSTEGCICRPDDEKCRMYGDLETVPGQRLLMHVANKGGDLDTRKLAFQDDILPGKACDTLKEHVANLYDTEKFPPVGTVPKGGQNLLKEEVYIAELDGETLIDLIGNDGVNPLVSFFYETMGADVPITKIHLQVGKNGDVGQSISHHKDDESTLLVFLADNDDSFKGGNLDYLTEDGHGAFEVKKGRGVYIQFFIGKLSYSLI